MFSVAPYLCIFFHFYLLFEGFSRFSYLESDLISLFLLDSFAKLVLVEVRHVILSVWVYSMLTADFKVIKVMCIFVFLVQKELLSLRALFEEIFFSVFLFSGLLFSSDTLHNYFHA